MFIVEESNSILVYDKTGRLVHKSIGIVQYKKFNEESMVVITKDSVEFISQIKQKDRYDITVVSDTKFVSAMIYKGLVFIQRKTGIPILDVYDSRFINVLRLYQNTKGEWVHFVFKFGIPFKAIVPTHINGRLLYGTRKGKPCMSDLERRDFRNIKLPKEKGIPLQDAINNFKVGGKG
ncbi:hypothetical protein [Lysinibacillus xylanilyticus]|uniref:hypothetical protein n=1 Tax=Lysinibacillus xylanilyticus TaxID=582475 RepID=UPI0036D9BF28